MAVIWKWAMQVIGGNGVDITRIYIGFCNQLKLDQIQKLPSIRTSPDLYVVKSNLSCGEHDCVD